MKGNANVGNNKNTTSKKTSNKAEAKTEKVKKIKASEEITSKNKKGEIKSQGSKKSVKNDKKSTHREFEELKKVKTPTRENNEIMNLIKIIVAVCVVVLAALGLAYGINYFRDDKEEDETLETKIQYEEILIGSMLTREQNEYYVLVIAKDDVSKNNYYYFLDKNENAEERLSIYYVDMSKAFNSSHLAEESNLRVSDITEFKIKESTLVKVHNKSVVEAYEGRDAILEQFDKIVK